jgi:hypothetical protein
LYLWDTRREGSKLVMHALPLKKFFKVAVRRVQFSSWKRRSEGTYFLWRGWLGSRTVGWSTAGSNENDRVVLVQCRSRGIYSLVRTLPIIMSDGGIGNWQRQ